MQYLDYLTTFELSIKASRILHFSGVTVHQTCKVWFKTLPLQKDLQEVSEKEAEEKLASVYHK